MKNRFSWQPSWILDRNYFSSILATFDLQVNQTIPTKFQVNWPFGSEAKNKFSRLRPSWISDQNDFSYF